MLGIIPSHPITKRDPTRNNFGFYRINLNIYILKLLAKRHASSPVLVAIPWPHTQRQSEEDAWVPSSRPHCLSGNARSLALGPYIRFYFWHKAKPTHDSFSGVLEVNPTVANGGYRIQCWNLTFSATLVSGVVDGWEYKGWA